MLVHCLGSGAQPAALVSRPHRVGGVVQDWPVLVGLAVSGNKHWGHSLRCQYYGWSKETAKQSEYAGYVLPSDVEVFPDGTYRRKAGEGGEPGGEALTNGELTHNHKVRKVGRILEMFHQNCLTKYTPGCYLSMDEQRVMMAH